MTKKQSPALGTGPDVAADSGKATSNVASSLTATAGATRTLVTSLFQNTTGAALSKHYTLGSDGRLTKTPAASLSEGHVVQKGYSSLAELAGDLLKLTPNMAMAFGVCQYPAADVRSEKKLPDYRGAGPVVTRGRDEFQWPAGPGVMLIDYDPLPNAAPLTPGELADILRRAVHELVGVTIVIKPSTSSCLQDGSGKQITGIKGQHAFIGVTDAARIPEVGKLITERLWLAGFGFMFISKSGTMQPRTLADGAVWQPERLVFGRAHCGDGLRQRFPPPFVFPGIADELIGGESWLDPDLMAPLTDEQCDAIAALQAKARNDAQPEADRIRAEWEEARIAERIARGGDADAVRESFRQARETGMQVMPAELVLHAQDGSAVTVAEVLADQNKWHEARFADPFEPEYGNDPRIAVALLKGVPEPYIHSHAHGGTRYLFRSEAERQSEVIQQFKDESSKAGQAVSEKNALPFPDFERSKNGKIMGTKTNTLMACRRPDLCGYQLRYDSFRAEIMLAPQGTDDWRSFEDTDYMALCLILESGDCGFSSIKKELIRDTVAYCAVQRNFDSARHWLNLQQWDGTPRVERFLIDCFGAEDSPYTRAIARYLWTALAGRVMVPGIKADMVPVAVGRQGAMKSSAVAAISPSQDFFLELDLSIKDADMARLIRGKLVIELGELRGLRAKEVEHLKSFITRTHEKWIPKFKEMDANYGRRCVFFGTTNKDEFLSDDTGNRRWLPFYVEGTCNPDAVARDRGQLWAEGREMFKANGVEWQDAEKLATAEHERFVVRDPWEEVVHRWLTTPDDLSGSVPGESHFTAVQALRDGVRMAEKDIHQAAKDRMARVLRTLGCLPTKTRINGVQVRAYEWGRNGTA